jgi:hypothetical protein
MSAVPMRKAKAKCCRSSRRQLMDVGEHVSPLLGCEKGALRLIPAPLVQHHERAARSLRV